MTRLYEAAGSKVVIEDCTDVLSCALLRGKGKTNQMNVGLEWVLSTFPKWDINITSKQFSFLDAGMLVVEFGNSLQILDRLVTQYNYDITRRHPIVDFDTFHMACASVGTPVEMLQYIYDHLVYADPSFDIDRGAKIQKPITPMDKHIAAALSGKKEWCRYWTNMEGSTPLMLAASEGNARVFKWLLEKKADPEKVNNKGETALSLAEKKKLR